MIRAIEPHTQIFSTPSIAAVGGEGGRLILDHPVHEVQAFCKFWYWRNFFALNFLVWNFQGIFQGSPDTIKVENRVCFMKFFELNF